jgi:soluble lytic murein transglycosylase-like protein
MRAIPRGLMLPAGMVAIGTLLLHGAWTRGPATAAAPAPAAASASAPTLEEFRAREQSLEQTRAELTLARLQLERLDAIVRYAVRYQIAADVATDVYDIALAEGVEPELAFRLIEVESNFVPQATSTAGAVGYTQVLPSTARLYEPSLTTSQLYERRTNLRLGFRYLRDLLERYADHPGGQLRLALLAYNRGPTRVQELLEAGRDPQNGYATAILRGYP